MVHYTSNGQMMGNCVEHLTLLTWLTQNHDTVYGVTATSLSSLWLRNVNMGSLSSSDIGQIEW